MLVILIKGMKPVLPNNLQEFLKCSLYSSNLYYLHFIPPINFGVQIS